MTDIKFPMIQTTKKQETKSLINFKGETIGTVLDFWKWAYSDLLDNAQRGILAEYLVANALKFCKTQSELTGINMTLLPKMASL